MKTATIDKKAVTAEYDAQIEAIKRRTAEQIAQLKARKQVAVSRAAKTARKHSTKAKILIGSMIIAATEKDPASYDQILKDLDSYLTREADRKLFGLAPISKEKEVLASPEIGQITC